VLKLFRQYITRIADNWTLVLAG